MRIQRTKNAGRNIIFGIIQKSYQIIMPFIIRTIMIYHMGIEYAGLNNLFVSILQVLNLAELGIGAAMICSMYEPIVHDDNKKICALINLYRTCYRFIGLIILITGCIFLPVLPKLISGEIPSDLNIYILYLMYLGNTVLSYWLFSYKNTLLYAHQRIDISSKVILLTNSFQYLVQIFILLVIKNYYLYLITAILSQISTNIITAKIVDKMYPQYYASGNVDKQTLNEIKRKVQGLITNKIGSVILNSSDSIVISSFLGLSTLAIYQNYYFVISAIINIMAIVYQSCLAGIGNSLIIEDSKKNFNDFKTMTFIISWILNVCSCCLICLFQPFMKIWMGPSYLLDYSIIICIIIYFYIFEIDQLIGTYKDAAGIWYKDRYRTLITAIFNVILNIFLVQYWGLYGVILSTIISLLLIGIPWMISNLFKSIFPLENPIKYSLLLLKYAIITIFVNAIIFFICINIKDNGISTLMLKLLICITIPNIINLLIFRKNCEFKRVLKMVVKLFNDKIIYNKINKHS